MITEVVDLNHPEIEVFKSMKYSSLEKSNEIIIESKKVFLKALDKKTKIKKILCSMDSFHELKLHPSFNSDQIFIAEETLLNSVVKFKSHTGVFALAEKPETLIDYKNSKKIFIFNGVTGLENIGAVIRSAAGFNINNLIYDSKSSSPWQRRPIRVSTGNIFSMNIEKTDHLIEKISFLKEKGFKVVSTANISKAKEIKNFDKNQKIAFIFGSEGHGVDPEILDASDEVLKISVNENVEHLNISHAAAITAFYFSELN